jgi:TonB family protein
VNKSNLYGLIGSTFSGLIVFLILWFVVLPPMLANKSKEDEGLLVSFGDSYDAGGTGGMPSGIDLPAKSSAQSEQIKQIKQPKQTVTILKTVKETYLTQKDNSEAIAEQNEKKRVRKEQEEIEAKQVQTNIRIADQKRKEQVAIAKANTVNGLFGNGGSSGSGNGNGSGTGTGTGKGVGSGSGNGIQGNPAGNGPSGVASSFKLGNRTYFGNPSRPNYSKDVEGKITVNIRVDENGNVTSATIGSPTTISDSEMRKDAISAANRTRFTKGNGIDRGSITYNYKLE